MNLILTSSQKRGFSLLSILLIAVLGFSAYRYYAKRSRFPEQVNSLSADKPKTVLVPLDVNLADSAQLESLPGLGPKLAGRIVKYRQKAGGFKTLEQVSKIYGLTPENFDKAKPWLFVADGFQPEKNYFFQDTSIRKKWAQTTPKNLVDINAADSLGFLDVKGIGPFLAGKIVKYRTMIGFYHSTIQLAEVRGMHPDNLEKILPQVKVESDLSKYPHLLVNIQSGYELSAHPYLSYKEGKLLEAYRKQHGPYTDSLSFGQIKEFPDSTLRKVLPYFDYRTE